nr:hypothetical protein GCM10020063_042170 [Dactylosporangium thailandense]
MKFHDRVAGDETWVQLVLPGMPSPEGLPDIDLSLWSPPGERRLGPGELDAVYGEVMESSGPLFVWDKWGVEVLIVAVGDNYSYISMLYGARWYELKETGGEEGAAEVEIALCGVARPLPKALLVPRERGLEVLWRASDFPRLRAVYSWRE